MALKHVRLELARDPDFPNGSRDRGYEFVAPLDDNGHLDAKEWRQNRDRCRVKRIWPHEPSPIGHLVHKPGGVWAFDYDTTRSDDDEAGFKLDKHKLVPGEYISFRESDGEMRTFYVVAVSDLD